jgi:hypothetical protein
MAATLLETGEINELAMLTDWHIHCSSQGLLECERKYFAAQRALREFYTH